MSQAKIRARREELKKKLKEADRQREFILLDMRHLNEECGHPKLRDYSAMGEMGKYCPDCEYQT